MRKIKIYIIIICVLLGVAYGFNVCKVIMGYNNINGVINMYNERDSIKNILTSDRDKIIIIDAGHGGKDPGKVGINDALEKNINLAIAYKVQDKLLSSGFSVIMTRTSDMGLYEEEDINKKNKDLKNRVNIINESDAIAAVSIHQNSYINREEKGAQVFYYGKSELGKELAICIQNAFKIYHNKDNKRKEKFNDGYYLLKKTIKPTVIVECGFLSNMEESNELLSEKYQDSIATAICNGVILWSNKIIEF